MTSLVCGRLSRFLAFAFGVIAVANATTRAVELTTDARTPLCQITVVDRESGWPVPLVELRTNHHVRFVTDNAGVIAFDLPELMARETWFDVRSDGYEVPADGFGMRGVRLTPRPGVSLTVEVARTSIAKRLGRLTGAGVFAESQKLGLGGDVRETGVLGADSVQTAEHRGKLFWAWGDTTLARYPLGVFHMSSATTSLAPLSSLEPPLQIDYEYFRDESGQPRGVAELPGPGPTWLSGYVSLPDRAGAERLVATYSKITPPLDVYERGLCAWNEATSNFEHVRTLWTKSDESPKPPAAPIGHPAIVEDGGQRWVLFGDPLPTLRCPATFEAWQDPKSWEALEPQRQLASAADGAAVKPHSGSIAWSGRRRRWIAIFMEAMGKPSAFGEIWYAEADAPTGPWGPAVKILSHANYTFYNPRIHAELVPEGSSVLLFEGTYTQTFADRPQPTPRYDYNQILYRIDLDDPRLEGAQSSRAQ
jgi:hypothetical protein